MAVTQIVSLGDKLHQISMENKKKMSSAEMFTLHTKWFFCQVFCAFDELYYKIRILISVIKSGEFGLKCFEIGWPISISSRIRRQRLKFNSIKSNKDCFNLLIFPYIK